jgi:hypothetical protein
MEENVSYIGRKFKYYFIHTLRCMEANWMQCKLILLD